MIIHREQVTHLILSAKVRNAIKWKDVAIALGQSKEWVTAACLGQMTLNKEQAEIVGQIFELSDEAIAWLQIVPHKGSLLTAVPTDPLIYIDVMKLLMFMERRLKSSYMKSLAMAL